MIVLVLILVVLAFMNSIIIIVNIASFLQKQDKVLDLLVQLLSQVVTQPSKPRVDQLKKMAMEFAKRWVSCLLEDFEGVFDGFQF